MKICHVTSSHRPNDPRIFAREVTSLRDRGVDVVLVANEADDEDLTMPACFVSTNRKKSTNRYVRLTVAVWRVVRTALKTKADCFHIHDPELLPYAIVFKMLGKKVVYDAHEDLRLDISNKRWIARPLRKVITRLLTAVESFCVIFCDAVVVACEEMCERFKWKKHVISVRNFPDVDILRPLNLERKPQVCYVGTINRARGVKEMICAAHQANVTLVLAGVFESQALLESCQQMPEWQCVEWLGYVDQQQINDILNRSIVGLLLLQVSQHFHPIKLYEYMAAGLPIIASDFERWRQVVEEGGLGFCANPFNVDEICRAIVKIKEDPQGARAMGEKARRQVCEKFSWQQESDKLLALYQRMGYAGTSRVEH